MSNEIDKDLERLRAEFDAADKSTLGPRADGGATADSRDEASYRSIATDKRTRALARHDNRIAQITLLQNKLRAKLIAGVILSLLLLSGGLTLGAKLYPNYDAPAPVELPLWMRQQQMLEQVAQVQEWLQDGQATSEQPPPSSMEELQAWLDQIQLNPELQSSTSESGSELAGFVPFQCRAYPISCPAEDVPSDSGEYRHELSRLVRNANIMLADKGDCKGTVNLIREYGSLFGWRRSEAVTKARTELSVARCFASIEDDENAEVHYQRTFCASVADPDPDQAMNALYGLARIGYKQQQSELVSARVTCSEDLLDYHLRQQTSIATLAIADPEFHDDHLSLMLTLQLNLMEGYITVNQIEPMQVMYEEVSQNPLLTDADRLIALGMLAMQDLISDNASRASTNLREIVRRYQTLSEFSTQWSWSAFDRWQTDTAAQRSASLDSRIREIRLALAPPRSAQALERLNRLLSEL